VISISKAEAVWIMRRPSLENKRSMPLKDIVRRSPTLKELQEKKYMILNPDLSGMLDDLEKGIIQLLEQEAQRG